MRRFWLGTGIALTLATSGFGTARLSAAETEQVALIWSAPPACPSTDAVRERVEKSLAGSSKKLAPVASAVTVLEVAAGHWQANLVVHSHGKRADRRFEAESCEALAEAAALIIALAAEGDEVRPVEPLPSRPVHSEPPPAPPAARPTSAWNRTGLSLLLGVVLDSHTMPEEPAPGFEAAVADSWTASSLWRLRLSAGASFFLPEERYGFDTAGVVLGRYWMLSLSGRGCLTAALSRFEIGPCLGGELVLMRGTNIGGTLADSLQYWASPLGSALAAFTVLPRVVLFARTEIVFPTTRRTFLGIQNMEVYTVPAFGLRGAVGVELRFL